MQRYGMGLILGLMAISAMAQEVSTETKEETAVSAVLAERAALPEGVTTEQHPLKKAYLTTAKSAPAVFRPSQNMPEIVNEDLLRGMADSGKPGKPSNFIAYMPKLKILPCAKGCEGSDYNKAIKAFQKGYSGDGKYFQERGEMLVQVRWFNVRPFLMRHLPYSADLFGVSFILEGKLVSLGKKSGVGVSVSAHELARDMGARLAMELAYSLGVGAKPSFLSPTNDAGAGVGAAIMATGVAVDSALGVEDVRSRVEPATEAHASLLPAIDGIQPGEIEPIDKMRYINSLMF